MKIPNLDEALQRLTYKPVERLRVEYEWVVPNEEYVINVCLKRFDATHKADPDYLTNAIGSAAWPIIDTLLKDFMGHKLAHSMAVEEWFEWLYHKVQEMEMHEVDEWFRIDGKQHTEAHPENERTYHRYYDEFRKPYLSK